MASPIEDYKEDVTGKKGHKAEAIAAVGTVVLVIIAYLTYKKATGGGSSSAATPVGSGGSDYEAPTSSGSQPSNLPSLIQEQIQQGIANTRSILKGQKTANKNAAKELKAANTEDRMLREIKKAETAKPAHKPHPSGYRPLPVRKPVKKGKK